VDVVVAWYTVPLVFYFLHRRWTTKRDMMEGGSEVEELELQIAASDDSMDELLCEAHSNTSSGKIPWGSALSPMRCKPAGFMPMKAEQGLLSSTTTSLPRSQSDILAQDCERYEDMEEGSPK